jgi:SAM-dependent methyltransferase
MRRLVLFLLNNILVNQILIVLGKDSIIKKFQSNWEKTNIDEEKTLQENVGFSHEPQVQEAIDKVHSKIQELFKTHCPETANVLDIGCGVGLYLQDFPTTVHLNGSDLSESFINRAKELLPQGKFYAADYLKLTFESNFDFIYSVSVIEYIAPSQLRTFFDKLYQELNPGGIVLIQYPHALNKRELYYPDLSYIQYSPLVIQKKAEEAGFKTLDHQHSFDGRDLKVKFDTKRYDPEKDKSFRNGAFYIAQKN